MNSPEKIRQILARHRAGKIIGLNQEHPIGYQMDVDYCSAINGELKDLGNRWEVLKATPNLWRQLPSQSGVYLFMFESGLSLATAGSFIFQPRFILYVGRAGDQESRRTLKERYRSEYAQYIGGDPEVLWSGAEAKTRSQRLAKYLAIYPLQYWYCVIEDYSKIANIESSLIKLLNPPLNTVGKTRLKLEPAISAFKAPI